jgi:hypothetical protein
VSNDRWGILLMRRRLMSSSTMRERCGVPPHILAWRCMISVVLADGVRWVAYINRW